MLVHAIQEGNVQLQTEESGNNRSGEQKEDEEIKKEQCPPQVFLKKILLDKHNTLCIKGKACLTELCKMKPLKKKKSIRTQVCL